MPSVRAFVFITTQTVNNVAELTLTRRGYRQQTDCAEGVCCCFFYLVGRGPVIAAGLGLGMRTAQLTKSSDRRRQRCALPLRSDHSHSPQLLGGSCQPASRPKSPSLINAHMNSRQTEVKSFLGAVFIPLCAPLRSVCIPTMQRASLTVPYCKNQEVSHLHVQ